MSREMQDAGEPDSRPEEPRAASDEARALRAGADDGDGLPEVDVWLLDGFNVLHAVLLGGQPRGRFWERSARDQLVARLARSPGRAGSARELVVVFDGQRPVEGDEARPAPGIEVVFAPSADDWIVGRVRQSETTERIGVVTQDRRVAGRARHAGALVIAPSRFLGAFPEAPGDASRDATDGQA